MRNRAKCKKCESVIESFHDLDYVNCKCGEISVSGGAAMYCAAIDWANFVRVDDMDREVVPKVVDDVKRIDIEENDVKKPNKNELVSMLQRDLENLENLPENARYAPITHYDFLSTMLLVLAVLKSENA